MNLQIINHYSTGKKSYYKNYDETNITTMFIYNASSWSSATNIFLMRYWMDWLVLSYHHGFCCQFSLHECKHTLNIICVVMWWWWICFTVSMQTIILRISMYYEVQYLELRSIILEVRNSSTEYRLKENTNKTWSSIINLLYTKVIHIHLEFREMVITSFLNNPTIF